MSETFKQNEDFIAGFIHAVKFQKQPTVFRMTFQYSSGMTFYYLFMQNPVGKEGCSYVYGAYGKSEDFYSSLDLKFKVYAVVTPSGIYFTHEATDFACTHILMNNGRNSLIRST